MWKKYCFDSRGNGEINYYNWFLKFKIGIFSFVILPSPNTKKNHPKWDFFPSLYRKMKDQNPSISEDFTKTFLKWPRHGLETTWRKCWSSRRKRVLRKLLRISCRRLKAGCSVCLFVTESFDWDRMKCTRCERLLLPFYLFVFFFFPSLENYFGFRTTNVKGKTDHSVSLRWNKRFWTFLKRRVFFWLCIRLLYELISPGWIKTRLYSVISSYGYFFLHSQIYILPLQNHLYPSLQSKNLANACEWTNLCA